MPEANGETDLRCLLRQAQLELEQSLRDGQDARAEQIFDRYPALAADPDSALDLIYSTEYTLRQTFGEEPTPEEFYARFPQHRPALEELFRLQRLVGDGEADLELPVQDGTGGGVEPFEVLGSLGQNGPVVVFQARQLSRDRLVAVKMLARDQTSAEELERFRRGCEDQARLDHPNVVRVFDRGEDEADVFFTMELGEGGTLARRIAGGPLAADEAARILLALADAVQHAHDRKILHRDLKPANVVLTADGTPKVTDFGLAKRLEAEPGPTRSGQLLGTPSYMAPEQVHGKAPVSERTDVYGLGAVLYEMLTGRPPFRGANELDTLLQVERGRVARPRRHNRAADLRLESICLRCLERRPDRRYPSARALAEELKLWQRGRWPRSHRLFARADRQVRRHPLLAALLLCCLAVPNYLFAAYLLSPERALKRALADLRRGEPVTWVGATGDPLYSRPVLPYGHEITGRSEEGAFVFGSQTISFLELTPDPQHDHYVFSAEVQRQQIETEGDVGLYFLYSQHVLGSGPLKRHWYSVVSFNDSPDQDKDWTGLTVEHHFEPSNNRQTGHPESIPLPPSPLRVWHKMAVEISPDEVQLRWDGGPPSVVSRRNLEIARDDLYNELQLSPPAIKPPLAPRSPLGLYAFKGSAAFRHVTLKPAPPTGGVTASRFTRRKP
jgi:serine/threonine-protein kinase